MEYVAVDIEAISLRPYEGTIWMLSINRKKKLYLWEDCNGLKRSSIPKDVVAMLEDESICKIVHSFEYDGPYVFLNWGIRIRNVWDSATTETVLLGVQVPEVIPAALKEQIYSEYSSSLEYTLMRYGMPRPDKESRKVFIRRAPGTPFLKKDKEYAKDDVKYLPLLQKAQEALAKRDGLHELVLLENRVAEKIARMRILGIGCSEKIWRAIAERNTKEFKKRIAALPKDVDNWNSEKQVKAFFRDMGIHIDSYKNLDAIYAQTKNELLARFIDARELHKAATAYGYDWLTDDDGFATINGDGRVRPSIKQIINTGRNAFSKPNLQQLPAKGLHRAAFIPRPGYCFVIGDFSGQELGIMAAASGEHVWIDAMLRGEDVHSLTASMLYAGQWQSYAEKKCTFPFKCRCKGHVVLRSYAKVLNFMLAYGGGPTKFSESTGLSFFDSKVIIRRYRNVVRKVTAWLDKNAKDAVATGVSYSADPYRRRRVLKGVEQWEIENQGKNNPVQAAGANMLKLAMVSIDDEWNNVLVVHDEIMLEVPIKKAKQALKMLKSVMEQSADYITGIKGLVRAEPRITYDLMKEDTITALSKDELKFYKSLASPMQLEVINELIKK